MSRLVTRRVMASKQQYFQPRLSDDVGAILTKLATKNGRTLPQELDFILRPLLLQSRRIICGIGPNGEGAEQSAYPSVADEFEIEAKGLRFEWNERRKRYEPVKAKKK